MMPALNTRYAACLPRGSRRPGTAPQTTSDTIKAGHLPTPQGAVTAPSNEVNHVPARLTKPTARCKALITLGTLLLALNVAADNPQSGAGSTLRDCVAQARNPASIAACEQRELASLKSRIDELGAAINARLDNRQRLIFERDVQAWQAFLDSEIALLDLSLKQRQDGLGTALRPGAVNRLYEQREQQLREHLHNLTAQRP
jgi:hypothetical protein